MKSIVAMGIGLLLPFHWAQGAENCVRLGVKGKKLNGWSTARMPPDAWKVVKDPLNSKKKAVLVEVGPETQQLRNLSGVIDGYRAELKDDAYAPVGQYSWYRFSFFIPINYPDADQQNPVVLAQWHDRFDDTEVAYDRSPPLAMRMKGDRLYFTVQYGQRENMSLSRLRPEDAVIPFTKSRIERGVWHTVEVEVLWSNQPNGHLKIRFNDEEVVDRHGPIGYDYVRGPYFKMGLYNAKSSFKTRHMIYFGEYVRAFGYAAGNRPNCAQ